MTASKHTPGPWYATMGSGGQGLVASETSGQTVAVVYRGVPDAHLIAAAPEMLEALRQIMIEADAIANDHRDRDEEQDADNLDTLALMALDAITKATGGNTDV